MADSVGKMGSSPALPESNSPLANLQQLLKQMSSVKNIICKLRWPCSRPEEHRKSEYGTSDLSDSLKIEIFAILVIYFHTNVKRSYSSRLLSLLRDFYHNDGNLLCTRPGHSL